jgi:lipopolysaccharide assembly outer membrane protein LptD (OstA)
MDEVYEASGHVQFRLPHLEEMFPKAQTQKMKSVSWKETLSSPATLVCDEMTLWAKKKVWVCKGHIVFRQAKQVIYADEMTYNDETQEMMLVGHVHWIRHGQLSFKAHRVCVHMDTEEVEILEGGQTEFQHGSR